MTARMFEEHINNYKLEKKGGREGGREGVISGRMFRSFTSILFC